MLRQPFAILRDGEPIELFPLKRTIRTGISFGDPRTELGMVAEYEEREAAVFAGIPWLDWLAMPMSERAACVAHARLHHMVSMHAQDAEQRDSELRDRRQKAQRNNDE